MTKQEYRFQDRIIKILRSKGYLVINAASKQIFDIVAIKNQIGFPIEIKAKETPYPQEQKDRQTTLGVDTNTDFFVIRQSKKRGKMVLGQGWVSGSNYHLMKLKRDLEEYLV